MADEITLIQRLGWDWRDDGVGLGLGPGVLLSIVVSGRTLRAFVPLAHVALAFDNELQKVGCVGGLEWVGGPLCVGGFFSSIAKAVKSVAKAVVPKVVQKAASAVVNVAKKAATAITKIPILGDIIKATGTLALLPANATKALIEGRRIDRIAVDQFKGALSSVKTLAPYVQTVVSFVPGLGTGISAGLGGALALASGQSISEAMLAAAKGAIPGGPAAQAAFSVASDVMQGRPIATIAINALPISPQAKTALAQGLQAAKDIAAGKNVATSVLDNAVKTLPAEYQKAIQVGVALGHAKNLQQAAGAAVQGAASLATASAQGHAAAAQLAAGVRSPALVAAVQKAQAAQTALAHVVTQAQAGHPQAQNVVKALAMLKAPAAPAALRAPVQALRAAVPALRAPAAPVRALPFGVTRPTQPSIFGRPAFA